MKRLRLLKQLPWLFRGDAPGQYAHPNGPPWVFSGRACLFGPVAWYKKKKEKKNKLQPHQKNFFLSSATNRAVGSRRARTSDHAGAQHALISFAPARVTPSLPRVVLGLRRDTCLTILVSDSTRPSRLGPFDSILVSSKSFLALL